MADEQTDKIIRLLEEIRDLTKERNAKLDELREISRHGHDEAKRRYEEALQRQKEAQERAGTRGDVFSGYWHRSFWWRQVCWLISPSG